MAAAESEPDSSESAVPTKCVTCQALQQVPFACDDCHQLLAHVQGADYFELFCLPRSYDLNLAELEEKYLAISRNVHPDRFATDSEEMQAFALRATAAVNSAYDVLREPVHRAEYLLEVAGGKSAAEAKGVPGDLLDQIMTLREEIEEARAAGERSALDAIRARILEQKEAAELSIAVLCRGLPTATPEVKGELRLSLNAMKYFNNLLSQL